jgi:hypothetical protein
MKAMEKIEILDDAVQHIRRRKVMYLGREEVIPENLATAVCNDALTLGVGKIEVLHCGAWWLIASEEDWLAKENPHTLQETFTKLLPLAGGGREALRREVLLTAFASTVFTRKDTALTQIAGIVDMEDRALVKCLEYLPSHYRVVGFKL